MNYEHALTKESVGGSISVFMFRLLLPCLLRLLTHVDGQPRSYHTVNRIHGEENETKCPEIYEDVLDISGK